MLGYSNDDSLVLYIFADSNQDRDNPQPIGQRPNQAADDRVSREEWQVTRFPREYQSRGLRARNGANTWQEANGQDESGLPEWENHAPLGTRPQPGAGALAQDRKVIQPSVHDRGSPAAQNLR